MPIEAFGRHTDTTRAPGRQHRHVPREDGRTPVSGKTDTQGRGVVRASRAGRAESPAVGLAPLSPPRRQLAAHRAALRARGDAAHYAPRRRCTLRAAGNHAASPATASCPAIHVIHAPRFTGLLPRDSRDAAAATTRRGAGQAPRALGRTSRSSSSSIPRFSGRITSCRERKGDREGGTERQGESEREPANPSGSIIPAPPAPASPRPSPARTPSRHPPPLVRGAQRDGHHLVETSKDISGGYLVETSASHNSLKPHTRLRRTSHHRLWPSSHHPPRSQAGPSSQPPIPSPPSK